MAVWMGHMTIGEFSSRGGGLSPKVPVRRGTRSWPRGYAE